VNNLLILSLGNEHPGAAITAEYGVPQSGLLETDQKALGLSAIIADCCMKGIKSYRHGRRICFITRGRLGRE